MQCALTNFGLRRTMEIADGTPLCSSELDREELALLQQLRQHPGIEVDQPVVQRLIDQRLVYRAAAETSVAELALRYRRNPLEHVKRVIFEITSRCNFTCDHCYNAHVPRHTETDLATLRRAADTFLLLGVRRYDFIGGEVSRYGNGWLELVRHLHDRDPTLTITLYTNGWWLEQKDFQAAGERYADDRVYCAALQKSGVSHLLFSLDGEGKEHDRSRKQPGLYDRIVSGFSRVKHSGIAPRVSLLWRGQPQDEFRAFIANLADRLYDFPPETALENKAARLALDETNKINYCIDLDGQQYSTEGMRLQDITPDLLRCKAFFRPSPSLTIKASGELATCRISCAGEGYGNIHDRDLVEILNSMPDAFIYKLHAEDRVADYLRFVDPEVFNKPFFHGCSLRVIVTMIACRMQSESIDESDTAGILRINHNVAKLTCPSTEKESG